MSSLIDREYLAKLEPQLKRITLRTRRALDSDLMGNYRSAFRGSGLSFAELREYTPGDDIKRIDWRATARAGKVYVKSFEEERQLSVILAVDCSASAAAGIGASFLSQTLTFASLIATLAGLNNDLCGLITFSDQVQQTLRPNNRRSQARIIMNTLVSQRAAGQTNIAAALQHLRQHFHRKSLVFLLSDFCSPSFEDQFHSVALHHDLILALPSYRLEKIIPQHGIVSFSDPESGEKFLIDCSHPRTRTAIEDKMRQHQHKLKTMARSYGADLIEITEDPLRALNELMGRRQRRVR